MKTLLGICFVAVFILSGTVRAQSEGISFDQYFINVSGIKGESTAVGHKDEIDVESFSFGASNAAPVSSGGGGGAGKVKINDFVIMKTTDMASPALFLACVQGEHLAKVVMTAVHNGLPYLTITLNNVLISSFSSQSSNTGGKVLESLSLNFTKIQFSYKGQNPNGTVKAPLTVGWDLATNKKL